MTTKKKNKKLSLWVDPATWKAKEKSSRGLTRGTTTPTFLLSRHGCWREATQQKRWACSVFSPARETFGEADYLMVDPPSQHAQKRVGRAQHLHALRDEVLLLGLRARPWTHRGGHPPCDSAPSGAYPTRPAARTHGNPDAGKRK